MARFIPVANIEAVVARSAPVKADTTQRWRKALAAAKLKLAYRRAEGHSKITGRMAREDGLIYLDDTRGDLAAHLIEFGHRPTPKRPFRQVPVRALTGPQTRAAASGNARA